MGTACGGSGDIVGFPRQDEIATGEKRKNTMRENSKVAIFDGHNDAVQQLAEYREGGRDFLVRSQEGHLDLPRAQEGGMIGGLFALFAKAERPACYPGNGAQHGPAVDRSYCYFLDESQDNQEQEKDERPVQRRNNERKILESFSNVQSTSHQHELRAKSGLDDRQAQRSVGNSLGLQDRRLEIDYRREANVEIGCKYDEFPQFFGCFFAY